MIIERMRAAEYRENRMEKDNQKQHRGIRFRNKEQQQKTGTRLWAISWNKNGYNKSTDQKRHKTGNKDMQTRRSRQRIYNRKQEYDKMSPRQNLHK